LRLLRRKDVGDNGRALPAASDVSGSAVHLQHMQHTIPRDDGGPFTPSIDIVAARPIAGT
jgi:hypothetical protein